MLKEYELYTLRLVDVYKNKSSSTLRFSVYV